MIIFLLKINVYENSVLHIISDINDLTFVAIQATFVSVFIHHSSKITIIVDLIFFISLNLYLRKTFYFFISLVRIKPLQLSLLNNVVSKKGILHD